MKTKMQSIKKEKEPLVFPCLMYEEDDEDYSEFVILATSISADGSTLTGTVMHTNRTNKDSHKVGTTKGFKKHMFKVYDGEIILSN